MNSSLESTVGLNGAPAECVVAPVTTAVTSRDVVGIDAGSLPDETPTASLTPFPGPRAAVTPAPADLGSGSVLCSRYELGELVGCGGLSLVFRARDRHRAPPQDAPAGNLVIKLLRPEQRANPWAIACLKREFRQMQRLSHPGIARVHALGCDSGVWFTSMELITGGSVQAWLGTSGDAGAVGAPGAALRIIGECCAALEHAHSRGILHGDLKPSNVMLAADGSAKLIDFGSAPEPGRLPNMGAAAAAGATALYASPQILMGRNAEGRDDVFSLACLSYAMLSAGRHPFGGRPSFEEGRVKMAPTRVTTMATEVFAVIERGLSGDRERRQASVQEFRLQLTEASRHSRAPIAALRPDVANPGQVGAPGQVVAPGQVGAVGQVVAAPVLRPGRFGRAARTAWRGRPVAARIAAGLALVAGLAVMFRHESSRVETPVAAMAVRGFTGLAQVPEPKPPRPLAVAAVVHRGAEAGVVSFGSPAIHAGTAQSLIAITVRRRGGVMRGGSFKWRVERESGDPVSDRASMGSRLVRFSEGQSVRTLYIPVTRLPATAARFARRSFTVVLERVAGGPAVGWPGRVTVAIESWPSAGGLADYQARAHRP